LYKTYARAQTVNSQHKNICGQQLPSNTATIIHSTSKTTINYVCWDIKKQEAHLLQRSCGQAVIMPCNVTDFRTNQKPVYDFLLANNIINLHPISHCLPDIVQYWSNYRLWQWGIGR